MEEFINHAKDPWHDEIIISSYPKYIDEWETSKLLKFIEYNKNKLTRANSDLEITLGGIMIYNVLTTKPGDAIDHFIKGSIEYYYPVFIKIINQGEPASQIVKLLCRSLYNLIAASIIFYHH